MDLDRSALCVHNWFLGVACFLELPTMRFALNSSIAAFKRGKFGNLEIMGNTLFIPFLGLTGLLQASCSLAKRFFWIWCVSSTTPQKKNVTDPVLKVVISMQSFKRGMPLLPAYPAEHCLTEIDAGEPFGLRRWVRYEPRGTKFQLAQYLPIFMERFLACRDAHRFCSA